MCSKCVTVIIFMGHRHFHGSWMYQETARGTILERGGSPPQDGPKTAPKRSTMAPDGSRRPHDSPRRLQDGPRRSQDGPRGPKGCPKHAQGGPGGPKGAQSSPIHVFCSFCSIRSQGRRPGARPLAKAIVFERQLNLQRLGSSWREFLARKLPNVAPETLKI